MSKFMPNNLFMRKSQKTSKLLVTGLCDGNSPITSQFPAQSASNAENVSNCWRHHDIPRGYFTDAGTFMQLPRWQWGNPGPNG